jgi:hypothetical protein
MSDNPEAHDHHEHHDGCDHPHHHEGAHKPMSGEELDAWMKAQKAKMEKYPDVFGVNPDHGAKPGGCSHPHEHPHTPATKGRKGMWIAIAGVAAAIGAYLINEYGKQKSPESRKAPNDWASRTQPVAEEPQRSL